METSINGGQNTAANGLPLEAGHGDLSLDVQKRMTLVSTLFPDVASLVPAKRIDPLWCFRATLKNGKQFLIWTNQARLSGVVEADGKHLFSDCAAARALKHPNILTPIHFTQIEDLAVVVTADFAGFSLAWVRNQKQGHEVAKTIFNQIANTVDFAHHAGVMHRALCPANILVDEEWNIRVFGFGIANVFFNRWSETMAGQRKRIADYLSPEVLNNGLGDVVPHCDGFSIGRVIYELLLGQLPKNSILVLPSKVCAVPAFVDDALLNAMHGEPKMRPQTIRDFQERFNGLQIRESTIVPSTRRSARGEQGERFFDGLFSFIDTGWFRLAMVLSLIGALLVAGLMYERYRMKSLVIVVEEGMTVQELLERWKNLSSEEIRKLYEQNAAHFEKIVEAAYHILVAREDYDEAEKFLEKMTGEGSATFNSKLKEFSDKIDEYTKMMDIAEAARRKGDYLAEAAPLARAMELFPASESLKNFQANNPQRIATQLSSALIELKRSNPGQAAWHYHLVVTANRVILDLSDHPGLSDISPLKNLIINELNLSSTGITSLEDLVGMPIDELRIDQTGVFDLSWVAGMPLRVLTFQNTKIEDISCLQGIKTLRSVLGQVGNELVSRILPPKPDQQTWINENHLKFRVLPGTAAMMAEREYFSKKVDSLELIVDSQKNLPSTINHQLSTSPLTSITFKEAENLCSHLTVRERKANMIGGTHRYRLPSDGEWSLAALLPESQFLSSRGRILQRVNESDYIQNRKSSAVLEIIEGGDEREQSLNGFWGLKNHIGEWVDHSRDQGDRTRLVRGIYAGSDLEKLRFRANEDQDKAAQIIGFRPVLEIDPMGDTWDTLIEANPERLAGITLDSWKTPHLSAAASSSLLLNSLLTSVPYREAYISAPNRDRDPFINHCYLRIELPVNWVKARSIAQQLGGRLAVAASGEHLAWLKERFVDDNPLGTPLWVGASAPPEKTTWEWVDESQVPVSLAPRVMDIDKRRGGLLVAGGNERVSLIATPTVERHAFLIEWEVSEHLSKEVDSL